MAMPDPSLEQSLVGAVLSRRFRLTEELGRGGMGAVYSGIPVGGGVPVAIKILHSAFLGDEQVMTRFLEEGRMCMRLSAPNILRVHEVLRAEDGSPYLVMDLLDGVPLAAYTRNGGRIAVGHAVPIMQGMLAGLAAAHEQGIVHRDLKPGNIFLARNESGLFVVKVLDFGIAKVMEAAGGMGNRTRTGMLLGTPAYMSPEQIKNAKDVDARADLWSAGVMFYEMLTGRTAFPAPTEYARLSAVLQMQPEPVERVDPQLSPLAAFVARAMEKDRAKRFATAREMTQALLAAAQGRDPASRVSVVPLSSLPDRPWMSHTMNERAAAAIATPARPTAVEPKATSSPPSTSPPPTVDDAPTRYDPMMIAPGGTLASHAPSSTPPTAPPTLPPDSKVVAVESGGTLSSAEARQMSRHLSRAPSALPSVFPGVRPWVVVLLVFGALGAGFLLGFALGRLH